MSQRFGLACAFVFLQKLHVVGAFDSSCANAGESASNVIHLPGMCACVLDRANSNTLNRKRLQFCRRQKPKHSANAHGKGETKDCDSREKRSSNSRSVEAISRVAIPRMGCLHMWGAFPNLQPQYSETLLKKSLCVGRLLNNQRMACLKNICFPARRAVVGQFAAASRGHHFLTKF